jgi:two-component system, chemotaxis family, protein-glutamate methylesterase/glutaminase
VAHRDLVVIGASAGGIEALQQVLSRLPSDLDAAVLIVLHTSSHSGGLLARVLSRASKLPVVHPADGTLIERGRVYVAPPNFHMIVEGNLLRVIQGPRENLHRPAIDPLFRSAAASYGRRVIGVVLTGALDDGTAGLMVVHAHGGHAIVQDPDTAFFSSMPESALQQVPSAQVLSLPDMAEHLVQLVREELPRDARKDRPDPQTIREVRIAELDMSELNSSEHPGQPSPFACPDCGGVLWETEDGGFLRFRCRVGHAFTARHLGAEQRHAIETALWAALRALEESASLYERMAARAESVRQHETAESYSERAGNTTANVRVLRDFLLRMNKTEEESLATEEV